MRRLLGLFSVLTMVLLGPSVLGQGDPTSAQPTDASPTESTATTEEPGPSDSDPVPDEPEPELTPRGRYNLGLELFGAGDWERAAEAFLKARDEAGPDPELRYRAAFNLGMSLASRADGLQDETPSEAIELLRQSSAWFNDAIRLGPESDDDARINLELVLKRIQQLADQLNQGRKLEARLERVIDDQRGLRDRVRRLLQTVDAEGVGAEPLGFKQEFDDLATLERTLQAEAGSIADLAAEERGLLEGRPEEERNDQERFRLVQLQNLAYYLQQARQSLSDSRRRLRRLEGERAHRRADAALAELKRAREQLLDPVTVLKSLAEDETALLNHTRGLKALSGGSIRLGDEPDEVSPPLWLNAEHLTERQQTISLRTDEVLARLEAGVSGSGQTAAGENDPAASPEQQRVLDAAAEAIPFLEVAKQAMTDAELGLPAGQLAGAAEDETRAVQALFRAIERFAGVRELIELAYADQTAVVGLLTPPDDTADAHSPLASLSTEERMRLVREAVDGNRERLGRLEGLLEDEMRQAEAQATEAQDPGAPAAAESPEPEAVRRKYELAEQFRDAAAIATRELADGLSVVESGGQAGNLLEPASNALAELEELRRLFFSLVEHLKELLRDEVETHDTTATLQFEADAEGLDLGLEPTAQRQNGHAAIGTALAQAVDRQADAAATATQEEAQQTAEVLAEVAGEVHTAAGQMGDASFLLTEAAGEFDAMATPDLEPVLEHQLVAIEHLENAIRLLEPPQQQQQDQQQQQQQPQEQPQQDEMSQRQAQRRLQAIRDREAERQRERQQSQQPEPVEKDW